jgi:hypothetical protein
VPHGIQVQIEPWKFMFLSAMFVNSYRKRCDGACLDVWDGFKFAVFCCVMACCSVMCFQTWYHNEILYRVLWKTRVFLDFTAQFYSLLNMPQAHSYKLYTLYNGESVCFFPPNFILTDNGKVWPKTRVHVIFYT